jgi:hypothetical protein
VCSVAPVSPVWNANQPMTTVDKNPAATVAPRRPNVRSAVRPKFSPLRPAT